MGKSLKSCSEEDEAEEGVQQLLLEQENDISLVESKQWLLEEYSLWISTIPAEQRKYRVTPSAFEATFLNYFQQSEHGVCKNHLFNISHCIFYELSSGSHTIEMNEDVYRDIADSIFVNF